MKMKESLKVNMKLTNDKFYKALMTNDVSDAKLLTNISRRFK